MLRIRLVDLLLHGGGGRRRRAPQAPSLAELVFLVKPPDE